MRCHLLKTPLLKLRFCLRRFARRGAPLGDTLSRSPLASASPFPVFTYAALLSTGSRGAMGFYYNSVVQNS